MDTQTHETEEPVVVPPAFRRRHAVALIGGATALALCFGGGGIALGAAIGSQSSVSTSTTTAVLPDDTTSGFVPTTPFGRYGTSPYSSNGTGGTDDSGSSSGQATTQSAAVAASDEQQIGVVTIVSTLNFSEESRAAGTGIVLTSTGQILTNNHVIDGATSIEVTVESTGKTYTAEVIGTDSTNDVALLQLDAASGLDTMTLDDDGVAVGDDATSVGNAEGTGDLVAASGAVTSLDEDITVGNEYSGTTESLSDLIEVSAAVVSGDSGGPLVDDEGEVIGVVTAASSGTAIITGFAIPIDTAMDIVQQIRSGVETDTVEIGLPAFLGVQLGTTQTGAGVVVGGVIEGTAAAESGLVVGDVITSFDGAAVATSEELSAAVTSHEVGDTVEVGYTAADGSSQTVTVTLTEGPA